MRGRMGTVVSLNNTGDGDTAITPEPILNWHTFSEKLDTLRSVDCLDNGDLERSGLIPVAKDNVRPSRFLLHSNSLKCLQRHERRIRGSL